MISLVPVERIELPTFGLQNHSHLEPTCAPLFLRISEVRPRTRSLGLFRLSPPSAHASTDIQLWSVADGACRDSGRHNWPSRALEQTEQLSGMKRVLEA